ncbi:MAG: FHA domain-containing protein [Chloroflexaceae bacterium]|jgi:hypothetical protein|nr:FHA domain-containing protein [Chloroflexaceae bacterium]
MSDRASVEKEINDTRKSIGLVERDVRQLREWISANERGLNGMQEALRRITEEGISKARSDLTQRESELQRLRGVLAFNERVLGVTVEMERKQHDIVNLEREQERIIVLLERNRTELNQLKMAYDELTRPTILPPCEIVLPNNQRIPLDAGKGEYVVGWRDAAGDAVPDIDLHPVGGSTSGVSRRHALLRFLSNQWTITDLGSTNGSFVNDVPVAPHTPTALADKSRIRLGSLQMFFRYITQTTRL